ncbi:MAG: RICIN domain-containing protein, partial [Bacteroidales bacterium]
MKREANKIKAGCLKAVLLLSFISQGYLTAQQLAFPGAEGFGRFATGGRGGTVYHVTNLYDDGPGSFRDAVSQSNRIVVFDVSGIINITDRIVVSSNITIAGQTAPGDGVVIYGNGLSFSGADNTICRYLRVRQGVNGTYDTDAVTIANGSNMIFDHMSVSWGKDENFSIRWNESHTGTEPTNITIQNSILGQGLIDHSCGGLIETNGGVSLLRNLYIDNNTRNPKVKGVNQFVNNVVYNWNEAAYILGDSDADSYANVQNNYFIYGPNSGSAPFTRGNLNFHIYASENYSDSDKDGILNGAVISQASYGTVDWQTTPYDYPAVTLLSPGDAYNLIVSEAGASLPARDEVDTRFILELTSLGIMGEHVSNEFDAPMNGVGNINIGKTEPDTDLDGMPDKWEFYYGLNPFDISDQNTDLDEDGYTNIEEYLNNTDPGEGRGILSDGQYVITASHSSKVLDISEGSTAEGASLIQQQLQKTSSQSWNISNTDSIFYSIINEKSGLAMTVEGGSVEEGEDIIQSAYTGADNQQWSINFIGKGLYSIINRNSSKAIEVDGGLTGNGIPLFQRTYVDSSYQKFEIYSSNLLENLAPEVNIVAPSAGTIFENGCDIFISAVAEDFDGNIKKVEFFAGEDKIGEDSIPPYRIMWYNVAGKNYNLSAIATDNEGLSGISADINIIVLTAGGAPATIQEYGVGYCSADGTIDNNHGGFTGDGFINTTNALSTGINWKVDFPKDTTYTFTWRFANGSGSRPAKLIVNGQDLATGINFPGTGLWTTWSVVSKNINVSGGIADVRLEATSSEGLANIDFMEISGDDTRALSCSDEGATGSIIREYYLPIAGSSVRDLVTNDSFPASPAYIEELSRLEAPVNVADEYGSRIRGFIHPKVSGEYIFWIAGNDNCELWLSEDIYPSAGNKIAIVPGWTDIREWDKYAEQQSDTIILNSENRYYIEIVHKEAEGEDNVSVAWSGPGITREIIGGAYLSPWTDTTDAEGVNHSSVDYSNLSLCNIYPNPANSTITIKLSDVFN